MATMTDSVNRFSPEQHNMANIEEIKEEYSYVGLVLCYQDPEKDEPAHR